MELLHIVEYITTNKYQLFPASNTQEMPSYRAWVLTTHVRDWKVEYGPALKRVKRCEQWKFRDNRLPQIHGRRNCHPSRALKITGEIDCSVLHK